jgi:zinc protease
MKAALAKLTLEDVNRAIRKHLRAENLQIVGVAKDVAGLEAQLTNGEATPAHYNSPKAQDILDEDKIVEKWPLRLRREDVTITPVDKVFER